VKDFRHKIFFRFPRDKDVCSVVDNSFSVCGLRTHRVGYTRYAMHPAFCFRNIIKFHSFSYLRYFLFWTMTLFFIQQYIVAKTSQFLTEIQNAVNSSPSLTLTLHLLLNSQFVTRDELICWRVDQTLTSAGCPLAVALGKPIGVPKGGVQTPPHWIFRIFFTCVGKQYCPSSDPIRIKS